MASGSARHALTAAIPETCDELRDFVNAGRGFGCYTDDTQMTLVLTEGLIEHGPVDAAHVSAKYAEFYEPWRGYGGAAHRVLRLLAQATESTRKPRAISQGGTMHVWYQQRGDC